LAAAAAGLALHFPVQTVPPLLAASAPAAAVVPPLAPQDIDLFLSAAGKEDGSEAFAVALHGTGHGTEDEWDTLLDQAPGWQDSPAVFPPAAR
jgi:hypothetical protein